MILYRCCQKAEIDAIKQNNPMRIVYGGSLYRYLSLNNRNPNKYELFDDMWNAAKDKQKPEEKREAILKFLPDFPRRIPISVKGGKNMKIVGNLFSPVDLDEIEDEQVRQMLRQSQGENMFLITLKLSAFFDDIKNTGVFLNECYGHVYVNKLDMIAVDLPTDVAMKFQGVGTYYKDFGCFNRVKLAEYAIPTYMLKAEDIVGEFKFGSEEMNDFVDSHKNNAPVKDKV